MAARRYRSWRTCSRERCPASAGGHEGIPWRLKRHGPWCCARLWCGRYHGPRPTFAATRTAVDLDTATINEQPVRRTVGACQRAEDLVPNAALCWTHTFPRSRPSGPHSAAHTRSRSTPGDHQMRLAAHVGRQQGRDPLLLRIRKPRKVCHFATLSQGSESSSATQRTTIIGSWPWRWLIDWNPQPLTVGTNVMVCALAETKMKLPLMVSVSFGPMALVGISSTVATGRTGAGTPDRTGPD